MAARKPFSRPAFIASGLSALLRPPPRTMPSSTPMSSPWRPQQPRRARTGRRGTHGPTSSAATADPGAAAPTSARLAALRTEMRKRAVQAMVVPSGDPHASEFVAAFYARRTHISAFNGSAGTAVVTLDAAHLWTDGRYFLQAEKQLDENWTLMRAGLPDTPTISAFLADSLPAGAAVGIDPFVHSIEGAKTLADALEAKGCKLVSLSPPNPVDVVWGAEQPPLPNGRVRTHLLQFAGSSVEEKLTRMREMMAKKDCKHMLVSMLDEVCWLFNIRGTDLPCTPVVISYGLVSHDVARLYIDERKLEPGVKEDLSVAGVNIRPYDSIVDDMREIAAIGDEKIWLDPSSTSLALSDAAGEVGLRKATPLPLAKARKNEAELQGMREAHLRDGVALSSFLCWLEDYVNEDGRAISEAAASDKLEEFRAAQNRFVMPSFDTISGSGPNGAVIHYHANPDDCGMVSNKEVFLLDSGGQYEDGTTDVTRTLHLGGTASDHEKECYTRVLQGHISIDTAVFPENTTGLMLDTLARVPLWKIGLDYRHGTGHGVGAGLNVHEGPQSISPRIGSNKAGLKPGMILSNEPGYYEDGSFGIRIENLLIVVEKDTKHEFGSTKFLGFERLTYVPLDKSMIMVSLLSNLEVEWLDSYHAEVWNRLSPRMEDGRYKDWLWEKTRPLLSSESSVANRRVPNTVTSPAS